MLWIFGYVLIGLWRLCSKADEDTPISALLLVLIGMELTYYIAYTVDYTQYLILGVAVAWVAGHQRAGQSVLKGPKATAAQGLRRGPST
jgi:hypothetical protein